MTVFFVICSISWCSKYYVALCVCSHCNVYFARGGRGLFVLQVNNSSYNSVNNYYMILKQ